MVIITVLSDNLIADSLEFHAHGEMMQSLSSKVTFISLKISSRRQSRKGTPPAMARLESLNGNDPLYDV